MALATQLVAKAAANNFVPFVYEGASDPEALSTSLCTAPVAANDGMLPSVECLEVPWSAEGTGLILLINLAKLFNFEPLDIFTFIS